MPNYRLRTQHSALSTRSVWRIGDWGGASGQIGRRWETVGDAALERLVGYASPNRPEFVPRAVDSLEGAEQFCRLGAGVLGALTGRRRWIFEPSVPKIDALTDLDHLRRAQRLMTTEQLIAYLQRVMSARAELVRTLNQLGREIYPFNAFRAALRAA